MYKIRKLDEQAVENAEKEMELNSKTIAQSWCI